MKKENTILFKKKNKTIVHLCSCYMRAPPFTSVIPQVSVISEENG